MLRYLLDGGMLMWPLLGLSIVGLAVALDRWRVFKLAIVDTHAMEEGVRRLLAEGKADEALRLCEQTRGPIAALLAVGLNRYRKLRRLGWPQAEVEASVARCMQDYAPHVLSSLERRVSLLLMVGSIAPLLGMTGTVTGMIRAFGAMASAEALKGSVVASGIAEALITTAAGLLIAAPAVVFYNVFTMRLDQFTLRIEQAATDLVDFLHLNRM
jgi:biopolymer transport protein ExbB